MNNDTWEIRSTRARGSDTPDELTKRLGGPSDLFGVSSR